MAKQSEESAIPKGLTQRFKLEGHTGDVSCITWSPDGKVLAFSEGGTIRLWGMETGVKFNVLADISNKLYRVAWSPDGRMLVSSPVPQLWDVQTVTTTGILKGLSDGVFALAWSPNGTVLALGSKDATVSIWDMQTESIVKKLYGHSGDINRVAWSRDGRMLASCSDDSTIRLWDVQKGVTIHTLEGHTSSVFDIAWSIDKQILASCSNDNTIRLWDVQKGATIRALEGHTNTVTGLSFSSDGNFIASRAMDGATRIWRTTTWECVAIYQEPVLDRSPIGAIIAFHPTAPVLASLGPNLQGIRIWDLDVETLLNAPAIVPSVYYTTAKIALVGDSGVGKSGLGYRIAKGRFQKTESTHGQQFWVVDKLGKKRDDGTECEAVLWDFAGQPNFRPIHALFLDDVDLALILFDPSRQDTFTGVDYWLKQLAHKQHLCKTVLVVARADVSQLNISQAELESYCREHNISGGFITTSAKKGTGVAELLKRIQQEIDWDAKPTTVTTQTFKRIKDYVLALKANAELEHVLVDPVQLRTQLEASDPDWQFTDAQMMGAVGHLQNHGYVTVLRRSAEVQSILLAPDLLINLAASYMLKARENEKGLGALEESRALRNEYRLQEVEGLGQDERDTLLNAVTELFLERNICFRESVDNQTYLIFPSLILERPARLSEGTELVSDTAYIVAGSVENVYPALVVLLGYSPSFQRTNQWRKQAQYETKRGEICGFKLTNDDPAELELELYYGKDTPPHVRLRFQGLFEEILYSRNVRVRRYDPVFCPKCNWQQERSTVIRFIEAGEKFLFCGKDGKKITLPKPVERLVLSSQERAGVVLDQALSRMRTLYETSLVRVKGATRNRKTRAMPVCFVSYAWGDTLHERWTLRLTDDLRNADIDVILDQLDNPVIGSSVARFISRIEKSDFILVLGTPSYRQKYENEVSAYGSVVAAEVDLINVRLTGTEAQKASVLPLLVEGEERTSFPPLLHRRVYSDFTREAYYFVALFDLVLTLYAIPFDDSLVRDLRANLNVGAEVLMGKRLL